MEFNHHRTSTTYEVRQPPLLNHKPTASPPPCPVHIHIDFLHQITHRFYNRPYHDDHDNLHRRPQLIATCRPPPTKTSICIPAHGFKSYPTTSHQIVSRVLANLRIQPSFQDRVADEVVTRARRFIDSVPNMGRRVIPVRVDVRTVHVHARDEREWVVRGLMESVLEGERRGDGGMVAANAEAVRGLKRKRVVEDRGESCRVCLEEFVKGEKVTCMPCRHVFHEGCIKTWLRTSHVCPICRFKMPTAD
ncbi:E3 ubiquitin-protein ligase SDIR1-like [Rhododendron vialii]|uniref:E3 ubiquitin-protein ligase SDIR1-like n=1 Tax=Rhododendron vialii TaxID=182163 RepID=UPI00265F3EF6|nr:E3 ubiquitin-protein ligase SDIR1-like [Rhododendron vialii]